MVYTKEQLDEMINRFIEHVRSQHALSQAFLFGSYAKGTARPDSDIDLALIFDKLDESGVFDEAFRIFHEAQTLNPDIEPVCFRTDEFESGLSPIIDVITREGIRII